MLALMGPKARALLQTLTPEDLSDTAFPFGTSREIDLGYARVRLTRITYVGEQGYEILMPAEFAAHVFDKITEAGAAFGLGHGGYFAINSLRMEKGYRHWGHDIGEEDTPFDAGLGFAVAMDKPDGFIGREALAAQKAGPQRRRMVQLRLPIADAPMLYHQEPILRDGVIVGSVTSGAYGHRVKASLGMGYVESVNGVTADWLASGTWEVEVAWKRYPVEVALKAPYDPKGGRIKG
jgi:glycine cleavage system aminomethyltransferase T